MQVTVNSKPSTLKPKLERQTVNPLVPAASGQTGKEVRFQDPNLDSAPYP